MTDTAISERTALYRLYDAAETLLYIGISNAPALRWSQHALHKPWWPQVIRLDVSWHDDRKTALKVERDAIQAEKPLHNTEHTQPQAPIIEQPVGGYRAIATDLISRIDEGEFPPGSSLPTLVDLTAAYGVARQTIRSALAVLATDGWVVSIARRGTVVCNAEVRTVRVPVGNPATAAEALRAAMAPADLAALLTLLSDSAA